MVTNEFIQDESGFVVSAELVLVGTILVLGLIVGMSQVQHAVAQELNDIGHSLGSLNQSYYFSGFSATKGRGYGGGGYGLKSYVPGSAWHDFADVCDCNQCAIACAGAVGECGGYGVGGGFSGCAASCGYGYAN